MKVRIEIDTKTFIRFWLVVIGFLLAGFALWKAKDALILIFIAAFLALALNQPVTSLSKILPGAKKNRVGATAVAYLIIVVVLGLFISFIIPPIAEQTSKFVNNLPSIVEDASKQYSGLQEFADTHNLQEYIDQSVESIKSYSSEVTKNIGSVIFGSVYAVANGIFTLFMVLMMTFFILVEGPEWFNKIWSLYSDKEKMKKHRRISNRMYKAVSAFVNGQLTVCGISGTCGALVVSILGLTLGVPTGLILPVGVILFLFGLIPMFGATIAGVLSAIIIGLNIPAAGIVFAIYFIIYQQIENNIISPMIQAKTNKLSALLVTVSITIGVYAFGLLGALISIPTAACIKILFEEFFLSGKKEEKPTDNSKSTVKLLKKIKSQSRKS